MTTHKCDGCRYKGEHVEMGFKPFGVCYKETNLIEAEKNFNAETCPYKYNLPQLYKTEPEPEIEDEPWPKVNPHLKPLPEIEETDDIINLFGQASEIERQTWEAAEQLATLAATAKALQPIIESLAEMLQPVIKAIAELLPRIIDLYPNKRVIHLAKHGKKARTRKKNINRIIKYFEREARMHKNN